MKVLFLDVDGVLNSAEWFAKMQPTKRLHTIDPKAVKRVLRVLEATGAKLVLSSTWRLLPELVMCLKEAGLPIYDTTPHHTDGHRGGEILAWLLQHPEVQRFAIVDDDSDAGELPASLHTYGEAFSRRRLSPYFVRTRWKHGLYGKHEKALIALLSD